MLSKRKPESDVDDHIPTKRQKFALDEVVATRQILSGERRWRREWQSYSKLPRHCGETDKEIFGIRFKCLDSDSRQGHEDSKDSREQNDPDNGPNKKHIDQSSDEPAKKQTISHETPLLKTIQHLRSRYSLAAQNAMAELLQYCGCVPQRRELRLEYGNNKTKVETDGVFKCPNSDEVIVCVDFRCMADRRQKHVTGLLPSAKGEEEKRRRRLRTEEVTHLKPIKDEENAQLALIMAAIAQDKLKLERKGEKQVKGASAHIVGIGRETIYMFSARVPLQFVQSFDGSVGFEIEYRSVQLVGAKQRRTEKRALRQLRSWIISLNATVDR